MNIEFDFSQIRTTEFGVGHKVGEDMRYSLLPVDDTVQAALRREAEAMATRISQETADPPHFDPAEKYGNNEYLVLPLQHELAASLAEFHEADHLSSNTPQLENLRSTISYFLRGTDTDGRRLTALNRASQFKATLGRQGRLIAWLSDSLHVISDPVMQLNAGFDIVIDEEFIHILHPASFRALGGVDEAIAESVPRNIEAISQEASFVDWTNVEMYATSHSRAANLLASIRTQGYAENLDKTELEALCKRIGVALDTSQGQVVVPNDQILPFLEVVDRRRYDIGLVPSTPEQYRASSRTRVAGGRNN